MRASNITVFICAMIAMLALLSAGWIERDRDRNVRAAAQLVHGDPSHGPEKIRQYGCYSCHTIPGITGANGLVGPPLAGIRDRVFLAGELPNTPENITQWIQHPRQFEPHTVMPEMGVTDQDSRDIAAYLYTLR